MITQTALELEMQPMLLRSKNETNGAIATTLPSWDNRASSNQRELHRDHPTTRILGAATAALASIALLTSSASAAYVSVYGGLTYSPEDGGFLGGDVSDVNNAGVAVGSADKYDASGEYVGSRAFRWDGSGSAAIELANLGADPSGYTDTGVYAINNAGIAVGGGYKYDSLGAEMGSSAIRWDASGAATELGNLGTDVSGNSYSYAYAVNAAGAAVGFAGKYDASGTEFGSRAVRWDASGAATELGNLGADAFG
jgi:hypothetical protein